MWTCHNLYDPDLWSTHDEPLADIKLKGVGGLVGFGGPLSLCSGGSTGADLALSAPHTLALPSLGQGYTYVPSDSLRMLCPPRADARPCTFSSGHPGVVHIESAIRARFPPDTHRVAWYINSRSKQSVRALPHFHMWVSRKPNANISRASAPAAGERGADAGSETLH